MAENLREILAHFEVSVDDKKLEQFESGIGGVVERLKHAGAAIAGFFAVGEIKEFFEATIQQAAHLDDLSKKLGVGTEELQKFQFAARLAGVDADSAAQSLGLLNRHIGDAILNGGESAQTFSKLGVSLKDGAGQVRNTGDVILDLSDKFKDMKSPQERAAYAMKLFGRAGQQLVPLLQGGREEMTKVYGELEDLGGLMSDQFIKDSKKADDEIIKMQVAFTGLRVRAVNALLPPIMNLVKAMQGWVSYAQKLIQSTHALQHAFEFLKILAIVAGVWKLVQGMKALAAAESLADIASPFTWALLAIGLLYLAYDDLKTALEGGDSLFGRAFGVQGIKNLKEGLTDVKILVNLIASGVKRLGDDIAGVAHGVAGVFKLSVGNLSGAKESFNAAASNYKDALGADEYSDAALQGLGLNTPVGGPAVRQPAIMSRGEGENEAMIVNNTTNVSVEVNHSSTDSPEQIGKGIAQGARKENDKHLLNTINAVKRR